MGAELGAAMMRLLPPVGWGDVATRRDLQLLEDKLDHVAARLDAKIDAKVDLLNSRIDGLVDRLETMPTKADLTESQIDLQRTLVTWILLAQATVVGAIGLLLGFLR